MSKQSLLNKAKETPVRQHTRGFALEDEELVLAWCNDEISLNQLAAAKGLRAGNSYSYIAMVARQIIGNHKETK